MGNDNSFKKHGLWFPNPLRRSAKKSSHALDIVFKVGDKFPRPHGKEWENFVEATQPVQFALGYMGKHGDDSKVKRGT